MASDCSREVAVVPSSHFKHAEHKVATCSLMTSLYLRMHVSLIVYDKVAVALKMKVTINYLNIAERHSTIFSCTLKQEVASNWFGFSHSMSSADRCCSVLTMDKKNKFACECLCQEKLLTKTKIKSMQYTWDLMIICRIGHSSLANRDAKKELHSLFRA